VSVVSVSRNTPTSQEVDGGVSRRRPKHRAKSSAPVIMVPVKRIGRDSKRCYCEKCGQKRRVCQCEEAER
jgi:hypothetical protein